MSNVFTVKANDLSTPFPHYWEMCVGSCHATMGLRADWREQLIQAHDELGFQYVRFHGLLDFDMSVCRAKNYFNPSEGVEYSFYMINQVFDFILSIGMKPFVEFGFMPDPLASGTTIMFHYKANVTPPRDYDAWADLIKTLLRHLIDRYGVEEVRSWFFEVWNEPNISFFWAGTQQEYFKLYEYSARAVKSVDKELRVGGPATAMNGWVDDFVAFCRNGKVPVDFVSTHNYPNDQVRWDRHVVGGEPFTTNLIEAITFNDPFTRRNVMTEFASRSKTAAEGLPLYYTEWHPIQGDGAASAAFAAKILADVQGLVEGYSIWTFSDLFEEGAQRSTPFDNGYGLMNIYGIPKPIYRLYQLLHNIGTERLPVETAGEGITELLATREADGISLMVYHFEVPGRKTQSEDVTIRLPEYKAASAYEIRLDEKHCNPEQAWIDMGRPEYPTVGQIEMLKKSSEITRLPVTISEEEGIAMIKFSIQPQSVVYIKIHPKQP